MNQAALDLLLRVAELPDMRIGAEALANRWRDIATSLVRAGLLVEGGWQKTIEDDDGLHVLEFDQDRGGHGYFSPTEGWINVEAERIRLYRLQLRQSLILLLGQELRMTGSHPRDLGRGLLFDVGTLNLRGRHLTSIWFARRLHERDALQHMEAEVANRPSDGLRLILTSTRRDLLRAPEPTKINIISIHDVASFWDEPLISENALRSRLLGEPVSPVSEGLWVAADGSELRARGESISLGGKIQAAVMLRLYEVYSKRERVKLEQLLADAGSKSRDLESVFKRQWQRLHPFIDRRNGHYTLKLPD